MYIGLLIFLAYIVFLMLLYCDILTFFLILITAILGFIAFLGFKVSNKIGINLGQSIQMSDFIQL